ncbi:22417_t:CDS:2 [Entrophospora sp. SA101]|nr:22417_t:CDS:2 [Entrophospora sp. SA101]CAJ0834457.1 18072_t:CDS:2 [Entrophospora sp. SA101]CAJ0878441.1 8751_t:CDS:2 [Entrophospora sp. SA101]
MDVVSAADTTNFELPLRTFDLLTLLKEIYAKVGGNDDRKYQD